MPDFTVPQGYDVDRYLRELAVRGLKERLGLDPAKPLPEEAASYAKRLEYELEVISGKAAS